MITKLFTRRSTRRAQAQAEARAHHEAWVRAYNDPRTWDDDELIGVGPMPSTDEVPIGSLTYADVAL